MKKYLLFLFVFTFNSAISQSLTKNNFAPFAIVDSDKFVFIEAHNGVDSVYRLRADSLLAWVSRNISGGGTNYFTLTGSTLSNNSGTQVIVTDTLNVGNMASPDAILNVNVSQHNTGLKAVDVYESEYNLHTFTLSPKGTAIFTSGEDYSNHPSALSVVANGGGASVNAAFSVTQNGSSGNAAATFMNGNVGIGTTTPATLLDLEAPSSSFAFQAGELSCVFNSTYLQLFPSALYYNFGSGAFFSMTPSGVGIGTNAAATQLDVEGGTVTFGDVPTGNSTNGFLQVDGSGNVLQVPADSIPSSGWSLTGNNTTGTNAVLGTTNDSSLNIIVNDTVRMSIDSSGNETVSGNIKFDTLKVNNSFIVNSNYNSTSTSSLFNTSILSVWGITDNLWHESFWEGQGAGNGATSDNNIFMGTGSGSFTTGQEQTFITDQSGFGCTRCDFTVGIGFNTGYNSYRATPDSNIIDLSSVFIGSNAGQDSRRASHCIFIGHHTGQNDQVMNGGSLEDTLSSILIGDGASTGGFSNSIAIGYQATNTATRQFALSDSIRTIKAVLNNGNAGDVLTNDGSGNWTSQPIPVPVDSIVNTNVSRNYPIRFGNLPPTIHNGNSYTFNTDTISYSGDSLRSGILQSDYTTGTQTYVGNLTDATSGGVASEIATYDSTTGTLLGKFYVDNAGNTFIVNSTSTITNSILINLEGDGNMSDVPSTFTGTQDTIETTSDVNAKIAAINSPFTGITIDSVGVIAGTATLTAHQSNIIVAAGAITSVTITLPSTPSNGDIVGITNTQTIATLTFSGGTVVGGVVSSVPIGAMRLEYFAARNVWYVW